MKYFKRQFSLLLIYLLSVLALIIYLYGFFPLEQSSNLKTRSRYDSGKNYSRPRLVDKLAFIVIDALRYDFVMPDNGQTLMPFTTTSILNNQSCLVKTRVHSPTVTMPRIKALTSGALSTYIDVVLNFMSSDFTEDNFINKAAFNGLKIVFYGDDTWMKLFPNAFYRSEGTNSFYTTDFTEVDNNVTRHIDEEFRKADWDIIILHYLGLDHIGHTEGPKSPLIKAKLQEMDDVVKKFSDHFTEMEKREGIKTMLIVTGDHGMKDSGSHGGVTYAEITVPLTLVGKPCVNLPGWPVDHTPLQIDIASTMSTFFGLPTPLNNMGKLIPSLLYGMPKNDILKSLEENRKELTKFKMLPNSGLSSSLENMLENWLSNNKTDEEVGRHIAEKYFLCLNHFSEEITSSVSDFKQDSLILGVLLLWIFLIILFFQIIYQFPKPKEFIHWFLTFGTILHALSLASSSFIEEEHQTWYFLWATFCVLIFLRALNFGKRRNIQKVKILSQCILLSLTHRFLRKLNQTGDKWAHLPDLKSYLNSVEGQMWLWILFLLGITMLFCLAVSEKCSQFQLIVFGICLLSVICYRIATDSFKLTFLSFYPLSKGSTEVLIFWTFMGIFMFQTFYNKTSFYLIWLLWASLLMRPHNVILLPLEVLISKHVQKHFFKAEDIVWNSIVHVWLGNLFYFYQGNGNSLANVDVAAGFVGIQSYNPVYAGIMTMAHTSNGHVLSFITSPKSTLVYTFARLFPLTLYCTFLLFQLHHLFIWSVFSPKLLYEANTTLVSFAMIIINSLYS